MKLAITGKGGVGKTTLSALISAALAQQGRQVYAIDADPDANLAATLGCPDPNAIKPLVDMKELIEERTGVTPGTTGGMFRLNPFVEDIPDAHAVNLHGVRLLVAGAVKRGGAGCYCPENALLRALVSHLLLDTDTDLVLDMEAGVEHFGRGTVDHVDHLMVVVAPGSKSVETAKRIACLAVDIGLKSVIAVGNRIQSEQDGQFLRDALPYFHFAGFVPEDDTVRRADMDGRSVTEQTDDRVKQAIDDIINGLKGNTGP